MNVNIIFRVLFNGASIQFNVPITVYHNKYYIKISSTVIFIS